MAKHSNISFHTNKLLAELHAELAFQYTYLAVWFPIQTDKINRSVEACHNL